MRKQAVTLPGSWPGTITRDRRGRLRIYLGRSHAPQEGWREVRIKTGRRGRRREITAWVHPAANSGGWTWLPRFIYWQATREALLTSEHVHHEDGDVSGHDLQKLRVVLAEYHGRIHAYATLLYRLRDLRGQFLPQPSGDTYRIPRYGAILGNAARNPW